MFYELIYFSFFFSIKVLEVMFEAFPQFIMGAFTIQALQLWELLNLGSVIISLISLLYSLGDYLAISAQGTDVKFSTTIWGVLAILTDIVFRGLFLAYMFSIIKDKTFPLLGRVIY